MPTFPDYWPVTENADANHPFRLVTAPARSFLNSSFAETPGSVAREGRPTVMILTDDATRLGIGAGDKVRLGNHRGEVVLHAEVSETGQPGTVIAEGLWPNGAHEGGRGINTLTGAEPIAPFGGAAFHDVKVWLRKV
jgi:anaerobic selenocysteine-containing dehydrogenase